MPNSNSPAGLVIGTAGHIDHGKTALVRALTGIDTDRLAEEKRRGISIDLGFAHLTLPAGQRISFIDVPGHERFVRNMLAGAAGIEAVLLIVAADESVKPQTREHFDICRLLGLRRGVIVLTKADLATPAQLEKTIADVQHLTAGSFLANAPLLAVSSVTGAGLHELRNQLASLASTTNARDATGLARLPIDRSFALKGFGAVVTGTLWSGTLHTGDNVQIHPIDREARIRGLERHGQSVESAEAGDRTSVNLSGIDHSEIKRGFVLTQPGVFQTVSTIDVSLEWLIPANAPSKRADFLFHIGTTDATAILKPLAPGSPFARLALSKAVLALPGDRFVVRRPSPALTVAGGTVVEAFPPLRLNRAKTLARLAALSSASAPRRIQFLTAESPTGLTIAQLVRLTGVQASSISQTPDLVLVANQHLVTREWIAQRGQKLLDWLMEFHAKNPAAAGAPVSQARLGLDPVLLSAILAHFPAIRVQGDVVSLASHQAQFSNLEIKALAYIERAFRQAAFQPPTPNQVLDTSGADAKTARSLLEVLVKEGKLVRLAPDLVFHADVITHIRRSLAAHKGHRFSVPEFKSWTNISRKYAIPLLEYLDHQRITRRDGDSRLVL